MNSNKFLSLVLAALSSTLLYFSFPNFLSLFGFWPLAWVGLVPFFLSLDGQTLLKRFKISLLFSFFLFAFLVSWLLTLNFLGYLAFIAALMTAPVCFALLFPCPFRNTAFSKNNVVVSPNLPLKFTDEVGTVPASTKSFKESGGRTSSASSTRRAKSNSILYAELSKWSSLIYCPSAWVATEFLRAHLFGGFSWTLGYSQTFHLPAIQIASVTGSYGISFFLVLFNYCLYRIFKSDVDHFLHAMMAVLCVLILFGYGTVALTADQLGGNFNNFYEIGSIQPNISPQEKLNEQLMDKMIDKHIHLTQESIKNRHPDLVIWPETAIPDDFIKDAMMREKVSQIAAQVKTHLLLGAALTENGYDYNCAVLLNGRGAVLDIYRKKYLVPFSEYLPWPHLLGFLRSFLNFNIYDFHPGKSLGLFTIRRKSPMGDVLEQKFGVTICSEGLYPALFRKLAGKGSGFVVLLLNDAWFKQEAAMVMHAQSEIMRAVENRLPIIRSANSGWSCVIESDGRVKTLTNKKPLLNKAGFYLFHVSPNHQLTFYNKYGDIFAVLCLVFVIINFVVKGILVFRKKRLKEHE